MTNDTHALIREMERAGCEIIPRFLQSTGTYLLTVKYRGESFQVTNIHRYPFQAAYDMWRLRCGSKAA